MGILGRTSVGSRGSTPLGIGLHNNKAKPVIIREIMMKAMLIPCASAAVAGVVFGAELEIGRIASSLECSSCSFGQFLELRHARFSELRLHPRKIDISPSFLPSFLPSAGLFLPPVSSIHRPLPSAGLFLPPATSFLQPR